MRLKITVDGKVYEVEVEVFEPEPSQAGYVPAAGQVRIPAAAGGAAAPVLPGPVPVADETKVCRSPCAGTISRIPAQVGQAIQVHDPLLILEAMKMETTITSPVAGKVARINANVGDVVQGGQVLVEFE